MKTFLGLKGLFVLLSLVWTCAEDWSAIKVLCSSTRLLVQVTPTLFHNWYMNPEEAFLGHNCPVTRVTPDGFYEFYYYCHQCGILIHKTDNNCFRLQTKIKFIASNSSVQAEIPVTCVYHSRRPTSARGRDISEGDEDALNWQGNPLWQPNMYSRYVLDKNMVWICIQVRSTDTLGEPALAANQSLLLQEYQACQTCHRLYNAGDIIFTA
ncbi:putative oocyte-secreted protein 1 homolog [Perognathus longimembris pacificus]|uniref:putative oocyte-secreted protein 1 homolog n=1 Tax=Perognathus longimembris pacificus TaxID=214514 RepID=UPI002019C2F1|nr:putative oocyte-secreted protein 1 homolog [Perognathus longimembris pacificus]